MGRPTSRHPTELELAILKILWADGPMTAREVRETLAAGADSATAAPARRGRTLAPGVADDDTRDLAHTSVLTILNIMVRKRYLKRRRQGKAYVFAAAVGQDEVTGSMARDLVRRAFDGSAAQLMLNLIETGGVDADELRELRRLIQKAAKEQAS